MPRVLIMALLLRALIAQLNSIILVDSGVFPTSSDGGLRYRARPRKTIATGGDVQPRVGSGQKFMFPSSRIATRHSVRLAFRAFRNTLYIYKFRIRVNPHPGRSRAEEKRKREIDTHQSRDATSKHLCVKSARAEARPNSRERENVRSIPAMGDFPRSFARALARRQAGSFLASLHRSREGWHETRLESLFRISLFATPRWKI